MNGDGKPDLLMAAGGAVYVLLGNGDGTFQPPVGYQDISGIFAISVAEDVKGDGELDVLAEGYGSVRGTKVRVLFGNGDGTFTTKPPVVRKTGYGQSFAVADLNGDGIPDLATGQCEDSHCTGGEGFVVALTSTGDGWFIQPRVFDAGADDAQSITAADLNGDGEPDLVVAHFWSNGVTVLLNNTVFSDSPTSTSLTSSQNPSPFGQKLTFTATVSSASGSPPDGEGVTFFNGSAVLGKGTLKGGVASLTAHGLPAGTYRIAASYRSDASLMASTSPVIKQVVTPSALTTTTLSSAPNPAAYGQPVVLTAVVTSGAGAPPDGETVTFEQGSTVLGTGTLTSGSASFSTSSLKSGTDPIKAVYAGDSNFGGSKSNVVKQVVTKAATTTTLASSLNPSGVGQSVTFTASVAPQFSGTVTGKVKFYDGTTLLKSVDLSGGEATYTTSKLTEGTHTITATYDGSADFTGSSASLTQTVN